MKLTFHHDGGDEHYHAEDGTRVSRQLGDHIVRLENVLRDFITVTNNLSVVVYGDRQGLYAVQRTAERILEGEVSKVPTYRCHERL